MYENDRTHAHSGNYNLIRIGVVYNIQNNAINNVHRTVYIQAKYNYT